jgi:hypothetical protein
MSKTLIDLAHGDCRWPVEGEGRFCASPRLGKSSYCLEHFRASIQRRDELDVLRGRGTPMLVRKAA